MSEFMGLILGRYEAKVCIHHECLLFRALSDGSWWRPYSNHLVHLSVHPSVHQFFCPSVHHDFVSTQKLRSLLRYQLNVVYMNSVMALVCRSPGGSSVG